MTDTNSVCRVCGQPKHYPDNDGLCITCIEQRRNVEAIKRQKKRDAAFGNPWVEAGVKDD